MTKLLPVIAGAAIGAAAAIGEYTFLYARGHSYLTNDPEACANCHVMTDHYAAWTKSSHRAVAVCNDCHTPPGLVAEIPDQGGERVPAYMPDDQTYRERQRVANQPGTCMHCRASVYVPYKKLGSGTRALDARIQSVERPDRRRHRF